jgi:hypothetical protein
MTNLIDSPLALTRADAGMEVLHFESQEANRLALQIGKNGRLLCACRVLDFSVEISQEPALVLGDVNALQRLTILLDKCSSLHVANSRVRNAIETVIERRHQNGRWPLNLLHREHIPLEMEADVGRASRWNTLRALRYRAHDKIAPCRLLKYNPLKLRCRVQFWCYCSTTSVRPFALIYCAN